jgi:hypothetical protein
LFVLMAWIYSLYRPLRLDIQCLRVLTHHLNFVSMEAKRSIFNINLISMFNFLIVIFTLNEIVHFKIEIYTS